jgi:dihydrofolate reductase
MGRLSLIVARARNGVIGANGTLPWRLPEDLAHFKRTTMGWPMIMGRKTWESIGRPLPGRRSIVVTRDRGFRADGADVAHSLDEAVALSADVAEVFVIGGAQLYAEALPRADRVLLTALDTDFNGDTFFPLPSAPEWVETAREHHAATGERSFGFDFVNYERRLQSGDPRPVP